MLRLLLTLSMTLNLLLLTTIVAARVDVARATSFVMQGSEHTVADNRIDGLAYRDGSSDSTSAYYESLRARGLGVDETKPLILAQLEASLLAEADTGTLDSYWAAEMAATYLHYELDIARQQASLRAAIVDIYGPSSVSDPAFRRIFKPLYPRLSFLTPDEHVEVQRFQLEQRLERSSQQIRSSVAPGKALPANFISVSGHRELVEKLDGFLKPATVTEYLIRYSPLASQMRSSDVQFSEAEFRAAYSFLEKLELGLDGPNEFVAIRASLRKLLGPKRFTQLWAVRDPMFAAIESAGVHLGLSETEVLGAYEVVNDTQEMMIQAAERFGSNPEQGRTAANDARAIRLERLSGLIGLAKAEDLLRAHSQAAFQMSSLQGQ